MTTVLRELGRSVNRAWENLVEGWRELIRSGKDALTRYIPEKGQGADADKNAPKASYRASVRTVEFPKNRPARLAANRDPLAAFTATRAASGRHASRRFCSVCRIDIKSVGDSCGTSS